jgi:hypothetical protein
MNCNCDRDTMLGGVSADVYALLWNKWNKIGFMDKWSNREVYFW